MTRRVSIIDAIKGRMKRRDERGLTTVDATIGSFIGLGLLLGLGQFAVTTSDVTLQTTLMAKQEAHVVEASNRLRNDIGRADQVITAGSKRIIVKRLNPETREPIQTTWTVDDEEHKVTRCQIGGAMDGYDPTTDCQVQFEAPDMSPTSFKLLDQDGLETTDPTQVRLVTWHLENGPIKIGSSAAVGGY